MKKPLVLPDRENITETTALRLDVAAAMAFPDGSIGRSGLRREAARGNLEIMRIAGKDYTTLKAIEGMIEKCRAPARGPDPGVEAGAAAVRRLRKEEERARIAELEAKAAGFNSARELALAALRASAARRIDEVKNTKKKR